MEQGNYGTKYTLGRSTSILMKGALLRLTTTDFYGERRLRIRFCQPNLKYHFTLQCTHWYTSHETANCQKL